MMNNSYTFSLTQATHSSGNVVLPTLSGVVMLTGVLLTSVPGEREVGPWSDRFVSPFSSTFSQHQHAITGEYSSQPDGAFEELMTAFYTKLFAQQMPLGADFEKILYDNLWDLYAD